MGRDHDACNTCLVLGLGFSSKTTPSKKPASMAAPATNFEPFLTLSLPGERYPRVDNDANKKRAYLHGHDPHEEDQHPASAAGDLMNRQGSPPSAVSSFSSGRVKRERDVSGEEAEVEKNSCRVSDHEDEDAINARKKLRLTKEQSALLEESFKQHSTLNPSQKQALARQLNLKPRQVEVWFQNRRARTKLKQTEVDCEFLKRCCETLTNENRRLQKELQELKALKMTAAAAAQPFYMPAASTLTMCPSCERRIGGDGNSKNPFSMPSKPHLYNPSSAAC